MIATVVKGKLEIHDEDEKVLASFEPVDMDGLAKFFYGQRLFTIACASSCQHPEDNGIPDVNVIKWIEHAFELGWMGKSGNPMADEPELDEEDMQLSTEEVFRKYMDKDAYIRSKSTAKKREDLPKVVWDDSKDFLKADWQAEVDAGETDLGYDDWFAQQFPKDEKG